VCNINRNLGNLSLCCILHYVFTYLPLLEPELILFLWYLFRYNPLLGFFRLFITFFPLPLFFPIDLRLFDLLLLFLSHFPFLQLFHYLLLRLFFLLLTVLLAPSLSDYLRFPLLRILFPPLFHVLLAYVAEVLTVLRIRRVHELLEQTEMLLRLLLRLCSLPLILLENDNILLRLF